MELWLIVKASPICFRLCALGPPGGLAGAWDRGVAAALL